MKEQLQAIVTVLSLVNPAICGAMFAQIEENRSRGQQVADATKAMLATTVILTVSALIGNPVASPVRRVPRCLHGGGRRRTGMDGLFHAERSGNLIDAAQCTVELWCVFDAVSPLRSESGDNHRGHYTLCCPYGVGPSRYGSGCNRRSGYLDLAGLVARVTSRQGQRGRLGA